MRKGNNTPSNISKTFTNMFFLTIFPKVLKLILGKIDRYTTPKLQTTKCSWKLTLSKEGFGFRSGWMSAAQNHEAQLQKEESFDFCSPILSHWYSFSCTFMNVRVSFQIPTLSGKTSISTLMIQKLFWKCTLQATLAQYPHWSCISSYFLQFHAGGRLGFPAHVCSQKANLQGNNLASSPSSTWVQPRNSANEAGRNSFLQLTPQGLFLEPLPLPLSSTCHNAPIIIPRNLCTWPSILSQFCLFCLLWSTPSIQRAVKAWENPIHPRPSS